MKKLFALALFLVLPFSASASSLSCPTGEMVQAEVSHIEYRYQKQVDLDPTSGRLWVNSGSKTAWTSDTEKDGHAPDAVFKVGILDYRWHVADTKTVVDSPEQCVPDPGYTPPSSSSDPVVEERKSGGSINYRCPEGSVTPYSSRKNGCVPATPTFSGPSVAPCAMLTALATNGASYCPLSPAQEALFKNPLILSALINAYNNR